MSGIRLVGIEKRYGQTIASRIDDLEIADGEVISFLGPSGCGKTTALRIIAGLTPQDRGDVYLGARRVSDLPPEQRNTAMVFQNYALFPHMTVFENIAFGLRVRRLGKGEIEAKVASALELVKLGGLEGRYPRQLSGGQQQRVALARAVVTDPDVLLFDEPLSNLDAKLREHMRFELRNFLKAIKITSVYVTHDQAEALVLSDKVVVMENGSIIQLDVPHKVYRTPRSRFVADFMGLTRFIEGVVQTLGAAPGAVRVTTSGGELIEGRGAGLALGQKVVVCVRPENIELAQPGERAGGNVFAGVVQGVTDFGEYIDYHVQMGPWSLRAKSLTSRKPWKEGDPVAVWLDPEGCVVVAE
jgi:ABC-type Fe3+/spermidine/putrescine transport system ATPase subunit